MIYFPSCLTSSRPSTSSASRLILCLSTNRPSTLLYTVCFCASVHDLNLLGVGYGSGDGPSISQSERRASANGDAKDLLMQLLLQYDGKYVGNTCSNECCLFLNLLFRIIQGRLPDTDIDGAATLTLTLSN